MAAHICSDESFSLCFEKANAKRDEVLIRREVLNDVLQCAIDAGQIVPDEMVKPITVKRQKVLHVNRTILFNFMVEHSAVCHAKERAAKKKP